MSMRTPTWGTISPERPLIILQTNNRFADSEEGFGTSDDPLAAAAQHGRETVRAWSEAVPDDIKPYCQAQMEIRAQNHQARYDRFRKCFDELQAAGIPANFQFADPHDMYVFDPEYVERLVAEYPCIQSLTITEINFEHYRSFNVPRYAISPEARYAMDIIDIAARHGKHLSISLQGLKWMHIGADMLNQPLLEKIREHSEHVLAVNEHIGPQHIQRQTSVMGMWLAGITQHWGVEPQSWWFENGRMIRPGVFGQYQADNTRNMPPPLYRAMILQGALLGATVYQFEPFWDLFDYDNAQCWREVIYPTLMEVIRGGLISTKAQVMEKMRAAYHYKTARDINEFHENLRDVDWIHDEGLLARAAYGLWDRFMEHELIPNKSRYFFIPLLPPATPEDVLGRFAHVIRPGECDAEADYEALLNRFYPETDTGTAWTARINGHAYVMQSHENLYERQTYRLDLPRSVRGLLAEWTDAGLALSWPHDPGAARYVVCRADGGGIESARPIAESAAAEFVDKTARRGAAYAYAVRAETSAKERVEGAVNYLDYLVFSESMSRVAEYIAVNADGTFQTAACGAADDPRPASQVVYPTFDGAEGPHRAIAEEIVAAIDGFKAAYDAGDWKRLAALYAEDYADPNGYHKEYADRAWKWWLFRNNSFCFQRQIRCWDFSDWAGSGVVRVHMFALCRALRRDDQPFGSGYDGTLRIPRTPTEEVWFTWKREDGAWRIAATDPALPNFQEMLWNSRGSDNTRVKLSPGKDGDPEYLPEGKTNLIPIEQDWLPKPDKPR